MRSPQRRACFAVGAITLGLTLPMCALLATDIYLHHRFERGVLFNVWGYRGPSAGHKRAGEYRLAVLGGSAAYGFGVTWDESMPAQLERVLDGHDSRFRVVNLAYNNEGAYSFTFTQQDYAYLKSDLVVLYEGYNDLMGDPDPHSPNEVPNRSVFRHESPIFRLTGYLPVFPIIFREKASILLYGDTRAAYRMAGGPHKTVFTPGLARRTEAEILQAAANIDDALERQLRRMSPEPPRPASPPAANGCPSPWTEYCESMRAAIAWARAHGQQVLIVTQPYLLGEQTRARHLDQQRAVASMVQLRFQQDDGVRYVNLGDVVDLGNPSLSFDRMHLTALGNARIAQALLEPVLQMAGSSAITSVMRATSR